MKSYSSSSWNVEATISLQKTNNGYSSLKINTPPQISHIPVIQHNYYQYSHYKLPVHDPDGDKIECRWAANFSEGGGVWNSRIYDATLSPVSICNEEMLGHKIMVIIIIAFIILAMTLSSSLSSSLSLSLSLSSSSSSSSSSFVAVRHEVCS